MLELLNKHKTLSAVAKLLNVDVSSVSRFCADNNIVRITVWEDLLTEQGRKAVHS